MNRSLKLAVQSVLVTIVFATLTACSSTPGNSELELLVKPTLVNPLYDVVSIRKVDGNVSPEGKALGINAYDVKYEYEVKFKGSLSDMQAKLDTEKIKAASAKVKGERAGGLNAAWASVNDQNSQMDFLIQKKEIDTKKEKYGDYKVGEIKKLTGTSSFLKTEKGWKL